MRAFFNRFGTTAPNNRSRRIPLFNLFRTHLMKTSLLQAAMLLSLSGIAGQTLAAQPPPPPPQCTQPGETGTTCPPSQYPILYGNEQICPNGLVEECVPAGQPPTPASLQCFSSFGAIVCHAWPQPVQSGLITYSWSLHGRAQTNQPLVGGSPDLGAICFFGPVVVTVILTSPGYGSSTVSSTVECNLGGEVIIPPDEL